jgi:CubicO group peptidase (beta-lactamase class C family)
MKRAPLPILVIALLLIFVSPQVTAQAPAAENGLTTAINAELEKAFKPNDPGASVIVVKDRQVLFRKGYGMANLELGVRIEPEMIFRIGSITKQFTAVATLMLMEQGKLSLSDEITKYLPDYPTQGHKITIEHLLTHTSGIKSYTGMPEWRPLWRKDLTLTELIDVFKNQPMEFAPGDGWNYNNSAYVLLGAIIEKASGMKYADFIEQKIFAPLGMTSSFYDNTARIIPRRAAGYSRSKDGYVNCEYLSMSHPHAAGSLMSTVDDLAKWDTALYAEKIVKQDSLKRAWTPFVMNGNRPTRYGYGWAITTISGERTITHGGGINGFTCDAVRMPDQRVYVAILTNRDSGVGPLAQKIAALTIGKPMTDPVATKLPAASLDKYVGVYSLQGKTEAIVQRDGETLMLQHPLLGQQELLPISETEFFMKVMASARVSFTKKPDGSIASLKIRTGIAPDDEGMKTDKPIPQPQAAAAVDPAIYDRYVGEYELMPNFVITITREGNKLMGEPTGQSKLELQPESATKFAIKEVGAQIEFVVEGEKATSLILYQRGQKLPAKRIK